MKRLSPLLLVALLSLALVPRVSFATDCATSTDIGSTYCTCDDGETTYDVPGHEFTSESCNSACFDHGDSSWSLTSCSSPDATNPGLTSEDMGNTTDPATSATGTSMEIVEQSALVKPLYTPTLNIAIPGLEKFTSPTLSADKTVTNVNFLAEYIQAVYKWLLGAAVLVAVVMMMLGGLQYMMARGKAKYIDKAKERITNAITGVVLLLAAFNIAYLVDPRLTALDPIGLANVQRLEEFPPEGEDTDVTPNASLTGESTLIAGDHIIVQTSSNVIDPETLTALQTAANSFYAATGKNVVISSGGRTITHQAELFYNICLATGGTCTQDVCQPSSGVVTKISRGKYKVNDEYSGYSGTSLVAVLAAHAAYGNCPHTSLIAVDAWCDDGGNDYKHDPNCQAVLIKNMIDAGFCRLTSEPWHFELNTKKISTACSTGNSSISYTPLNGKPHSPGTDCAKWDFKYTHTCTVKK